MNKLTVRDIDVGGKRVLVRADFNVPLDEAGAITDDSRIRATLPTIKYLIERKARVILCSHLGRPGGKVVEKLRMAPVARRLSELLGQKVEVAPHSSIGPEVEKKVESLKGGDVLLLENLRFQPGETENAPSFTQALASLADMYVNDAFGASHRAHASIVGVANYLPAVAGLLLEKEIDVLEGILAKPAHPFAELAGGAKVSDKIAVFENTLDKVDSLLIGGGMAATFLKAKSYETGSSLVEDDKLDFAAKLLEDAAEQGVRLLLPVDVVIADKITPEAEVRVVSVEEIVPDWGIVDIGPETISNFSEELRRCKTVFWNGPMGVYEIAKFAKGTQAMAKLLAGLKATTVVGGGSTAEVVAAMKLADKMTFVSTGGGASLRFLGGEKLPGVEVLLEWKG